MTTLSDLVQTRHVDTLVREVAKIISVDRLATVPAEDTASRVINYLKEYEAVVYLPQPDSVEGRD